MLWQQPQEKHGRRVSCAKLVKQPVTLCWPSASDDDRRQWQHGMHCEQGMVVQCHEGSEIPEHTAGIGLSLERDFF